MTERSLPWDGTTTGDAGDYTGAEWQENQRHAIGLGAGFDAFSGVMHGSDLLDTSKRGLDVEAQNPVAAAVNLRPGSAVVNGVLYINDAVLPLSIAANASGNPRIDSVILRKDTAAQTVRALVKQGTPAGSPVAPSLTQSAATWEIGIADIAVANGFTTLAQSTIQPTAAPRNESDGLYHIVLNNSGGTLKTGDVVIWDTSAQRAVTTTTIAGNAQVAGTWVGTTPNGSYGRVLYKGIGLVRTDAAVTRGQLLRTSATAKQAGRSGTVNYLTQYPANFAYVLETTSGTGLALCFLDCVQEPVIPAFSSQNFGGATISSATFTNLLSVTLTPTGRNLFAQFTVQYFDNGVANPNFNLLSLSIFEAGINLADFWGAPGNSRIIRTACNDMRRTAHFFGRRLIAPAPGVAITFDLRWAVSAGTATSEAAVFTVFEM